MHRRALSRLPQLASGHPVSWCFGRAPRVLSAVSYTFIVSGTKHGLLLYMRKVHIRAQGSDLLGSARALVVRAQVPCGDHQERRDARTSARVLSVETCRLCVCSRRLLLVFFKLGSTARSFVTFFLAKALRPWPPSMRSRQFACTLASRRRRVKSCSAAATSWHHT